jgi:hypothetical protein
MEAVVDGVNEIGRASVLFPSFHLIVRASFFFYVVHAEKVPFCWFGSFSQTAGDLVLFPDAHAHPGHGHFSGI